MTATWRDTIDQIRKESSGKISYGEAMHSAKPVWAEIKLARGETPAKPAARLRGKQARPAVKKVEAEKL